VLKHYSHTAAGCKRAFLRYRENGLTHSRTGAKGMKPLHPAQSKMASVFAKVVAVNRARHGVRREAKRHAALGARGELPYHQEILVRLKAVSPLRSATAVQDATGGWAALTMFCDTGEFATLHLRLVVRPAVHRDCFRGRSYYHAVVRSLRCRGAGLLIY
jgi:hypothetical protein